MISQSTWRTRWWVVPFDLRLFRYVSSLKLVLLPTLIVKKYWCKSILGGQWATNFGAINDDLPQASSIDCRWDFAGGFTDDHYRLLFTWNARELSSKRKYHSFFFTQANMWYFMVAMGCELSLSFQWTSSLVCQNDDILPTGSLREAFRRKCKKITRNVTHVLFTNNCRSIEPAASGGNNGSAGNSCRHQLITRSNSIDSSKSSGCFDSISNRIVASAPTTSCATFNLFRKRQGATTISYILNSIYQIYLMLPLRCCLHNAVILSS